MYNRLMGSGFENSHLTSTIEEMNSTDMYERGKELNRDIEVIVR